ncbi:MAG TPA: acetolactate synthase small subunit, partial [Gemmatimonadales bacterium]
MSVAQAVVVLLEDHLITLNRVVGLIRRRTFPVHSLSVGPTGTPGVSRLTIMMQSDESAAERAVQHLQKIVGVHDAAVIPQSDAVVRELALVKLRPAPERYAELLDVVQLYRATLVDESLDGVVLELTGSEAFVLSCLRALERFAIVEVARSGAVAMESGTAELPFGAQPQLE